MVDPTSILTKAHHPYLSNLEIQKIRLSFFYKINEFELISRLLKNQKFFVLVRSCLSQLFVRSNVGLMWGFRKSWLSKAATDYGSESCFTYRTRGVKQSENKYRVL